MHLENILFHQYKFLLLAEAEYQVFEMDVFMFHILVALCTDQIVLACFSWFPEPIQANAAVVS